MAAKNISGKEKTTFSVSQITTSVSGRCQALEILLVGSCVLGGFNSVESLVLKSLVMLPMPRITPLFIKRVFSGEFSSAISDKCLFLHSLSP